MTVSSDFSVSIVGDFEIEDLVFHFNEVGVGGFLLRELGK
jgi:hypothetical protein